MGQSFPGHGEGLGPHCAQHTHPAMNVLQTHHQLLEKVPCHFLGEPLLMLGIDVVEQVAALSEFHDDGHEAPREKHLEQADDEWMSQ